MMKLSEQQQKAIEATGQVLLLAVPGSGKTTTLVARLRHMVMKQGIDPSSILVITYTNAAANDMKARFLELTRAEADAVPIRFCTINSFCYAAAAAHFPHSVPFRIGSGRYGPADYLCEEPDAE